MIKNVDVIFFVEHKDRELESIKKIAERLHEKGISSVILSEYFHLQYLFYYKAKVFVFPYLLNKNDWPVNFIYATYGNTVSYINMNWEQLISKVNEEYKKPQDDFVRKKVHHIAWSKDFKNYLLRYGVHKDKIEITGNPANEILASLLHHKETWKHKLSKEFNLDERKKWIFLPMNYGWAFASDTLINAKILKGYPAHIAWEYRTYSQKCLKEFIYFIDTLSQEYDYELIIRPHPSITIDNYIEVFKEQLGYVPVSVTLNKAYSIREWVISVDTVGSSWSTSVWDAYNIGKDVFLFTPYARPEWLDVWWNEKVLNVSSTSGLLFEEKDVLIESSIKSIEHISSFLEYLSSNEDKIKNRIIFALGIKNIFKMIRSLLRYLKIIKNDVAEYDKFEVLVYI